MEAPRRTRALFVCGSLGGGGAERFVATALARLDRSRIEPALCLFRRHLGYGLDPDVRLDVLEKNRPWDIPIAMARLARHIGAWRPDVVFSAFAHPNFVTGSALTFCRPRPRWIARVSNDPERGETGAPRPIMRRLYGREVVVPNLVVDVASEARGPDHTPAERPSSTLRVAPGHQVAKPHTAAAVRPMTHSTSAESAHALCVRTPSTAFP